jgi:hypothetical protein
MPPGLLKHRKGATLFVFHKLLEQVLQLREVMKCLIQDLCELWDGLLRKRLACAKMFLKTCLQRVQDLGYAEKIQPKIAKSQGLIFDVIQEFDHLQGNAVPQSCRAIRQPQEMILFCHREVFLVQGHRSWPENG